MNYLLDTHIVLWWLTEPQQIASKARNIIADKEEPIFISSASFWEMAIKQGLGKLKLPVNIVDILTAEGFAILPIQARECLSVVDLPLLHFDPFDRLLVVQAKLNDMIFITRDEKVMQYPVVTLRG